MSDFGFVNSSLNLKSFRVKTCYYKPNFKIRNPTSQISFFIIGKLPINRV